MARQGNGLEMPPNCPIALCTISKHHNYFNFKITYIWKGNNLFQKRNQFLHVRKKKFFFLFFKECYIRTEGLLRKVFKSLLPRFQGRDLCDPLPGPLTCQPRASGAAQGTQAVLTYICKACSRVCLEPDFSTSAKHLTT